MPRTLHQGQAHRHRLRPELCPLSPLHMLLVIKHRFELKRHTLRQLSSDALGDQIMAFFLALFSSKLLLSLHLFRFLSDRISFGYGRASASVAYLALTTEGSPSEQRHTWGQIQV